MPRKRSERRRQETAYHEAGHAVAAVRLDRPFKSATIVPADDYWGVVMLKPFGNFHPDYETDLRTLDRIERSILVLLAGGYAAKRFTGRYNRVGARQDWRDVHDLAFYRESHPQVLGKYLDYLVALSKAWVDAPLNWVPIKRVAAALLERETLSAKEVKRIVWDIPVDDAEMREEQTEWRKRIAKIQQDEQRKFLATKKGRELAAENPGLFRDLAIFT